MRFRHTTPARNLGSILRYGLAPRFARCSSPAIWIHSAAKTAWAIGHTARRHRCAVGELIVIVIEIPRGWCKASGRRGLYHTTRTIPAARIAGVALAAFEANPRAGQ